jgi:TPR repeat protein
MLVNGVHARAGVAKDAARGFKLLREAVDQGYGLALYLVADCYLKGEGVEKDAAHGVSLLRQVINQDDSTKPAAEASLTICHMEGNGVEADTLCRRAAMASQHEAGGASTSAQ